jgi:hypothetical protein
MACSKYTITNTGSTTTNFNYRRCDDSLWEYQVELLPSQTKNIWLISDTYSTAYYNNIDIIATESWPPIPEPTISVYSQVLDFMSPPTYNSINYKCDGTTVQSCYSPGGEGNINDLVALFNSNFPSPPNPGCEDPTFCYCWTDYGTYYDNGDGRIRCEMPTSVYNSLCLGGTITLNIIND